jgi:signal transduction histidine kinase
MDRRRFLVDVAVALIALAISAAVLAGAAHDPALRRPDVVAYWLLAVYSGSVVVRSIDPMVAAGVGLLAGVAYSGAGYPLALTPVVLLSVYSAGARLPKDRSRAVLVGAVALAAVAASVAPGPTSTSPPLVAAAAWFLGHYVQTRRRYTESLEAQNRVLEQARHDLARQAVVEERLRIARELHDVVAHSMSVVAVHAGSGRMVAAEDPAAAERALATIEVTTRSALREMRRLLGVLRSAGAEEPAALEPAPGLADLDALVAQVTRSGVDVELRVEGRRTAVPAGVDLSAYRVVQEALTNVIKHAGPARAVVEVRYTDTAVTVEVVDDGQGAATPAAAGGHGLVGMRERVAVHGGVLDVGPGDAGGFHVSARFPVTDGDG